MVVKGGRGYLELGSTRQGMLLILPLGAGVPSLSCVCSIGKYSHFPLKISFKFTGNRFIGVIIIFFVLFCFVF